MDKSEPYIEGYRRKDRLCESLISSAIITEDEQCKSVVPTLGKDGDTISPENETVKQSKEIKMKEILNQ